MRIKNQLKEFLIRFRLWYPLNFLRRTPDILYWLKSGCTDVAPHPVKMLVVRAYLNRFSIDRFFETGTYLGETLGYIAETGIQCISIELSQELYDAARKRFRDYKNVKIVQGDSGQKLPQLLNDINKPTLFWLDGHYSAGITARAKTHTPVSKELEAILRHPIKQHVVLIDDARYFDGSNDYPHLDELMRLLREEKSYNVEVSTDIIRITPNF